MAEPDLTRQELREAIGGNPVAARVPQDPGRRRGRRPASPRVAPGGGASMSALAARSDGAAFRIVGHRAPRPDATDKVFGSRATRTTSRWPACSTPRSCALRPSARIVRSTRARPKRCRGPRAHPRDVPHNVLFSDVLGQTNGGPSGARTQVLADEIVCSRRGRRARGAESRGGRGGRAGWPSSTRTFPASSILRRAASRRAPARAHGQRISRWKIRKGDIEAGFRRPPSSSSELPGRRSSITPSSSPRRAWPGSTTTA